MAFPEIKFYMGCDTRNGLHALVVADNSGDVQISWQTKDKVKYDAEVKRLAAHFKIPEERILTETK